MKKICNATKKKKILKRFLYKEHHPSKKASSKLNNKSLKSHLFAQVNSFGILHECKYTTKLEKRTWDLIWCKLCVKKNYERKCNCNTKINKLKDRKFNKCNRHKKAMKSTWLKTWIYSSQYNSSFSNITSACWFIQIIGG